MSEKVVDVESVDPSKSTSAIKTSGSTSASLAGTCIYNGAEYGTGAQICVNGHQRLICQADGSWQPQGPC